jgi:hypothetical protein
MRVCAESTIASMQFQQRRLAKVQTQVCCGSVSIGQALGARRTFTHCKEYPSGHQHDLEATHHKGSCREPLSQAMTLSSAIPNT